MNQIAKLLPLANVLLESEAGSKKRVFERVGLLFENNHNIGRSQVFDSLFAREKLGSTALGQGGHDRNMRLEDRQVPPYGEGLDPMPGGEFGGQGLQPIRPPLIWSSDANWRARLNGSL